MHTKHQRLVLAGVVLSSFLTPFTGSSVNIALPAIGRDFHLDAVSLNWVATSFLLASTTALIPVGRIADLTGRARVFTAGAVLFTASSLVCTLSSSFGLLLAGRVAQGLGGAMIFSTGIALLTQVFPARERGGVLGWNVAVVYLGLSLGPFIGGALTQSAGWRSVFMVVIPLGMASAACVWAGKTQEEPHEKTPGFDYAGTALYTASLPVLFLGLSRPTNAGYALAASGAAGLVLFCLWEKRAPSPLIEIGFFTRNRIFALSNLAALIHYAATFSQGFMLSLYLQYIKGLDPFHAGLVLIVAPVVMALLSPLSGALSDRVEPRVPATLGMGLTTLALALLSRIDEGTSLAAIMAVLFVSGVGFALFSSPNTNAVMGSVRTADYGVASGTLATMRMTGQTLSMAGAMLAFAVYLGQAPVTPQVHPQFIQACRKAFGAFALVGLPGIWASFSRGDRSRSSPSRKDHTPR